MHNMRFFRTLLSFLIIILSIRRLARVEHWSEKTRAIVETGVVLTVALIWVYSARNGNKRKTEREPHIELPATSSQSDIYERKSVATNMKLIAVILLIAGCFSMRPLFSVFDFANALRAQQAWPSVIGKVLTVQVESDTSKAGHIYWYPVWSYSYIVGDNSYASGSRDLKGRFALVDFPSRNDANAIASQRPVGAEVTVYYDPSAPQRSLLDRRTWTLLDWMAMLVAAILPVVTFGTSAFLLYRAKSTSRSNDA